MKYIIPTLFILILGLVLIASILEKKSSNKIGEGDVVKQCVIDTMFVTESPSTIEYGKRYNYKTSCDEVILTKRNNIYEIGDTLTFIYKKR
jgi:hypothetical protein